MEYILFDQTEKYFYVLYLANFSEKKKASVFGKLFFFFFFLENVEYILFDQTEKYFYVLYLANFSEKKKASVFLIKLKSIFILGEFFRKKKRLLSSGSFFFFFFFLENVEYILFDQTEKYFYVLYLANFSEKKKKASVFGKLFFFFFFLEKLLSEFLIQFLSVHTSSFRIFHYVMMIQLGFLYNTLGISICASNTYVCFMQQTKEFRGDNH